jgi:hypothetical protein
VAPSENFPSFCSQSIGRAGTGLVRKKHRRIGLDAHDDAQISGMSFWMI